MSLARALKPFSFAALMFPLSACEEHQSLLREKSAMEAELAKQQERKAHYDSRTYSSGVHPAVAAADLEQKIIVTEKGSEVLTQEIAELSSKKVTAEQAIANFRAKVDAFRNSQPK